jgi:hypothetical protein
MQSQKVFYVEVWDSHGNRHVAVQNAQTEEEALELAKKWTSTSQNPEECRSTYRILSEI